MKRFALISGLLVTGLLSGVALSACGGDSAPETPIVVTDTTQNLTKDEFISQADSICDQANGQIAQIAAAGQGITRANDVADIRQGEVTDIRALGSPTDSGSSSSDTSASAGADTSTSPDATSTDSSVGVDTTGSDTTDTSATGSTPGATGTASDLETFLTAMADEVKAGQKIGLASQRGDDTTSGESDLDDAKQKAADAASAYGFLKCGTDGTSASTTSTTSGTEAAPSTVTPSAPSTSAPSTSGGSSGSSSGSGSGTSGGGVSAGGGGVGPG